MSFSSQTKEELTKLKLRTAAEKRAVLCALTYSAGSITLGKGGVGVQYITENQHVGGLIAGLASELYAVEYSVSIREHARLRGHSTAVNLAGGEACKALLQDAGYLRQSEGELSLGHIPEALLQGEAVKRCYLRGAFLGAGSLSDPAKGYHLELVCRNERFAVELCGLLEGFDLGAKHMARKNSFVVYMKEGESISDFLRLVGAMNSTMAFEDVRVLRSVSGSVNRARNFEDANMNKAAAAAARQLVDIACIQANAALHKLGPRLREAAEARLNNPEASLLELSELMGVSKSGLNHRFEKLAAIACALRLAKGDTL
ncbi:MAG: DNA-binding protein WhiA [Christensenellaceae bacterium]|nr:DNA-binding protein WhiA [Christensenellaceae bacterium]